jgi:protease IV
MKEKIKHFSIIVFVSVIILTMGMFWYDQANYYLYFSSDNNNEIDCQENQNVALIKIQGEIVTYDNWHGYEEEYYEGRVSSEGIVSYIEDADGRDHIEAIIIEIDSYGGSPVASEEIMNAIKQSKKMTVAVIREAGISGAYLIASAADYIYANEMSDIGGIGVTMSYLDYSQTNKREGIAYQELTSAKFKDIGNPDKDLTEEEREFLMRDISILHDIFVRKVTENRGLDIEKAKELADGSTMLGEMAKENNLIDEIGDAYSAKKMIEEKLNIVPEVCFY